jgi:hypothetical protein
MATSNFIIKATRGKNTTLDNAYGNFISKVIHSDNEAEQERWETYNLILKELLPVQGGKYFQEIRYRITDGENPNEVFLDVLNRNNGEDITGLAWYLKRRVEDYLDEDFTNSFC